MGPTRGRKRTCVMLHARMPSPCIAGITEGLHLTWLSSAFCTDEFLPRVVSE